LIEPFTFPKDGNAAFQITRDALKDMFGGFGTEVLPISIVRRRRRVGLHRAREGASWPSRTKHETLSRPHRPKRCRRACRFRRCRKYQQMSTSGAPTTPEVEKLRALESRLDTTLRDIEARLNAAHEQTLNRMNAALERESARLETAILRLEDRIGATLGRMDSRIDQTAKAPVQLWILSLSVATMVIGVLLKLFGIV